MWKELDTEEKIEYENRLHEMRVQRIREEDENVYSCLLGIGKLKVPTSSCQLAVLHKQTKNDKKDVFSLILWTRHPLAGVVNTLANLPSRDVFHNLRLLLQLQFFLLAITSKSSKEKNPYRISSSA